MSAYTTERHHSSPNSNTIGVESGQFLFNFIKEDAGHGTAKKTQVKAVADKPDGLRLIPRTHMMEAKSQLLQATSQPSQGMLWGMFAYTHTHTKKKLVVMILTLSTQGRRIM